MNFARIKLACAPSGLEEVSITTHTDHRSGKPIISSIRLCELSHLVYDYTADNSVIYPKSKLIDIPAESLSIEDIIGYGSQTFLRDLIKTASWEINRCRIYDSKLIFSNIFFGTQIGCIRPV